MMVQGVVRCLSNIWTTEYGGLQIFCDGVLVSSVCRVLAGVYCVVTVSIVSGHPMDGVSRS